ncbi:PepSY domain-containing protein [Psychroserpens sp. NJDZ02]|uniref:PepSY domain-containing protein n=1 Tax=Psychroserpens sp. NJDZ02 TaxID=2570561 RepID=UPI0021CDED3D|nr:PepSY domain-containing protein [Psychroserpens sp. NJDZ02]
MTVFFAFILKGHMRLWLPKSIGEQVVGVSILLFIIIIISGFILWLPKKRKNLKQRITFDWKKQPFGNVKTSIYTPLLVSISAL